MRKTCRECGVVGKLDDGLCWKCREREGGAGRAGRGTHPRSVDLEPAHDQPWVPTNQLADRVRRSPRE